MEKDLPFKIALGLLPGIGDVKAKNLVAYCGGPQAVFAEKKQRLRLIPGIGEQAIKAIAGKKVLDRAEEEVKFINKEGITPLFYLDAAYPTRLKQCEDSPVMLYYKGTADLNTLKVLSIVGSRKATDYGYSFCERLVKDLAIHQALVVSGLAYGIDSYAHHAALKNDLLTVAVLAHGLDQVYPGANAGLARRMHKQGGLLTEFPSRTRMHPDYFPRRNRIIAGLADAVIVVEASMRSGSLITANIANSYNRDVFAVPGRVGEDGSEGCNFLIKVNKAALLTAAKDIEYIMGWDPLPLGRGQGVGLTLFPELKPEEEQLVNALKEKPLHLDELCYASGMTLGKVSAVLLSLEFAGLVRSLPGKMYKLN